MKNIVITTFNVPHHAENTSEKTGVLYVDPSSVERRPEQYVWLIGNYFLATPATSNYINKWIEAGKKIIVHWIGSDISDMFSLPSEVQTEFARQFSHPSFIHLAEIEYTQKELKDLGIHADICPLPLRYYPFDEDIPPLRRDKLSVAIYMYGRPNFYHWDISLQLIHEMRDWDFHVFGGRTDSMHEYERPSYSNVTYYNHVDVFSEIVPKTNVLVRMTEHDGLPLSVVEFMMAKRFTVFNNSQLPGALYAHANYADVKHALETVEQRILKWDDQTLNKRLQEDRNLWMSRIGIQAVTQKIETIINP